MDVSRIRKKNINVWLPLFEDVEVLCQYLSQKDFDEISEQATTHRHDPKTHRRVSEQDAKQFRQLLARAVVKDWRGMEDEGKPYPCSPENIDYMMENCTEFRLLVLDAPLSLERMLTAEKEDQEKNSLATSGAGLTSQA